MQWHKLALIAGAGALAYWALKPAPPEPEPEPSPWWDITDWWDTADTAAPDDGNWITDSYQDATDWISDYWDSIWE